MPIDYKNYPLDWHTRIRPSILARANHCCESCGVPNYSLMERDTGDYTPTYGSYKKAKEALDASDVAPNFYIIVLTISHTDHFPFNNSPENLRAICQRCHNRHDAKHRANTRKRNRAIALERLNPSLPLVTSIISKI